MREQELNTGRGKDNYFSNISMDWPIEGGPIHRDISQISLWIGS
jgi:hypothetical protein